MKTIDPRGQWELNLVGLTDSNKFDSFIVEKINNKFVLKYSFFQSISNLRLLYHIKNILGYGKVFKISAHQLAHFTISDLKVIKEIIIPIFDKYPLLTRKYFVYLQFKEVLCNLENESFTDKQKTEAIENLLIISPYLANDCVSPTIACLSEKSNHEIIKSFVSMDWLVGFIEGRGNLYVLSEQNGCFNVGFSIWVEKEVILLQLIKRLLHISNKIIIDKNGYFVLKTNQSRSISNIINVLSVRGSNCKFKGMKSFEFKLWRRAFLYKNTNNINKLAKVHSIIKKFKSKFKALI